MVAALVTVIRAVLGQGYIDRHYDVDRGSQEYADGFAAGQQTRASNGEEAVDRCVERDRMSMTSNGILLDTSRYIGCVEGSAEALSLDPERLLREYDESH
ncbi:MAG: hypothetical protein ACLGIA_01645 [Actinomycetes bacterium]